VKRKGARDRTLGSETPLPKTQARVEELDSVKEDRFSSNFDLSEYEMEAEDWDARLVVTPTTKTQVRRSAVEEWSYTFG